MDCSLQKEIQKGCPGWGSQETYQAQPEKCRAIQGSSWTEILAKRNQKPEIRKAQRDQAVKAAKAKKQSDAARKTTTWGMQKQKVVKQHKGGRANIAVRR